MLFFADSGERRVVQGMLMGAVVSVMTVLLLLLNALDHPFHSGVGGLEPVAMERSLRTIDEALRAVGVQGAPSVRRGRDAGVVTSAGGKHNWVELVATVLLAVATVATAWSGYQSTLWNGSWPRLIIWLQISRSHFSRLAFAIPVTPGPAGCGHCRKTAGQVPVRSRTPTLTNCDPGAITRTA